MSQFIKYGAIAILVPILAIREVLDVLKSADVEIPDPDDILNEIKEELSKDS
jgi:hypothetical protein